MDDQQLRDLLHEIIHDVDAGRVTVPRPRGLAAALGAPVLVAALGLGACSGAGQSPAREPAARRDAPPPAADAAAAMAPDLGPPVAPAYGVPPPLDRPTPPPMDPGAVAEYAVVMPMDPGPQPEYAAPHRP
jgi:hypothetical protein